MKANRKSRMWTFLTWGGDLALAAGLTIGLLQILGCFQYQDRVNVYKDLDLSLQQTASSGEPGSPPPPKVFPFPDSLRLRGPLASASTVGINVVNGEPKSISAPCPLPQGSGQVIATLGQFKESASESWLSPWVPWGVASAGFVFGRVARLLRNREGNHQPTELQETQTKSL